MAVWAIDLDGTVTAAPEQFKQLMTALKKAGDEVDIVSASEDEVTPEVMAEKAALLKALGMEGSYDRLVVVKRKKKAKRKAKYLKERKASVLIDNTEKNAQRAVKAGVPLALLPWGSRKGSKALAGDSRVEFGQALKADETKHVALFVAYAHNKLDVGVAKDGRRDFAAKDVVEDAAHAWMRKGARLGLFHKGAAPQDLFVCVESSIHHGPDWVMQAVDGNTYRVIDGDWLIAVKALTDPAWEFLKKMVGGASPEGPAVVTKRPVDPARLANLRGQNG